MNTYKCPHKVIISYTQLRMYKTVGIIKPTSLFLYPPFQLQ